MGAGGASLDELGVRSVGAMQKALPGLIAEQELNGENHL